MKFFNNLPIYEGFVEDENDGMFCISLVDSPATEASFMYFEKDKEPLLFSIQDEEKHLVRGLLMGADQYIYRRKGDYEYYITYSADTLKLMAEKYLKEGFSSNVDLNHDGVPVEGINMTQIFAKDTAAGINPKGFEEYNDGSLFVEFKVNNEEVWEQIKEGNFKGFSLAGLFEVKETFNKQKNKKDTITMKIEKIKEALRRILASFGSIATDKGTVVWQGDDDLKEGDSVNGVDAEGGETELEDGEYRTEDKKVITIENGVVVSIVDSEAEVAPENEPEEKPEEAPEEEPKENEEPEETPEEEPKEEEKPEEEPAQEEPTEEPEADPKDERIANLEAEVARLEEENGALKERIKELEGEPAAEPANEQFKKAEDTMSPKMKDMIRRGYKL